MDCSQICFRFSPEEIFSELGEYFSLNGKLASDISFPSEFGWTTLRFKEYKLYWFLTLLHTSLLEIGWRSCDALSFTAKPTGSFFLQLIL